METVICVWLLPKFFIGINDLILNELITQESLMYFYPLFIIFEIYSTLLIYYGLRPKNLYDYRPLCVFNGLNYIVINIYHYYYIRYQISYNIILLIGIIMCIYELYMIYKTYKK